MREIYVVVAVEFGEKTRVSCDTSTSLEEKAAVAAARAATLLQVGGIAGGGKKWYRDWRADRNI